MAPGAPGLRFTRNRRGAVDELECFAAVVAEQGFSAAAARLGTTTAAVSRRIKALEQRLGVRLQQRTTRRVQLTEAGETYYREVHRLLQDLQAVEQQLQEVTRQPTGELRIVAPMSFGQRRLAPALAGFAAAHPKLRINLKLEDRETDIVAESFDVALRIAYPADSSYVARPIAPGAPLLVRLPGLPGAPRNAVFVGKLNTWASPSRSSL